jgi:drug/metabolite transporter (DMT)-like permease
MIGPLASLGSAACWATASLLFARVGRSTPAAAMNFLKCVIALVLMQLTLIVSGSLPWPLQAPTTTLMWLAASGLVGLATGDTLYFLALLRMGPRRTLLVASLAPVITTLSGIVILGEAMTLQRLVGTALTIGGVYWVISERSPGAPPPAAAAPAAVAPDAAADDERRRQRAGVLFALGAAVCQATGQLFLKAAGDDCSALEMSVVRLTAGMMGIALQLVLLRQVTTVFIPFRTTASAVTMVVAAILGTYAGVWLMNVGIRLSPVGLASTLSSTSPIFVLPLAALFLGERLSVRAIAGAVVAVAGVALLVGGAS